MKNTSIEWTDATWNPIRGCSRVSAGCVNCYAERVAARFSGRGMPYEGLAVMASETMRGRDGETKAKTLGPRWTGKIEFVEDRLEDPIRWKKPRRIFVNSMSDLFHENVQEHWIERIFAVMALAPQHTFQVLTKRADRMFEVMSRPEMPTRVACYMDMIRGGNGMGGPKPTWPLPNVWLGVSVEDQQAADERITKLLQTPAAVRWISAEPLLGRVDLHRIEVETERGFHASALQGQCDGNFLEAKNRLDWVVVGGESGPGARPLELSWARIIVEDCKSAGVPVFVKQLGAVPVSDNANLFDFPDHVLVLAHGSTAAGARFVLESKKGGDITEWPEDLQVREFPLQEVEA